MELESVGILWKLTSSMQIDCCGMVPDQMSIAACVIRFLCHSNFCFLLVALYWVCHSKSTGLTISLDFHIFIYLVPLSLCVLRTLKAYKDILYNRLDTAVSLVHGNCFCLVKLRHVIKCYRENESRLTMLTKMVWCSSSGLFVAPSGVETIGDVPSTMMLPSRHSIFFSTLSCQPCLWRLCQSCLSSNILRILQSSVLRKLT